MARTGRRPGNQDTREAILVAARRIFSEQGFDGASIRAIATDAGVDPALVHHYFGTKDHLFITAMRVPIDPGKIIPGVLAGDIDHLGERIVRAVLTLWDSPAGTAAAALLRSAVQKEWTARLLREFLTTQILRRVTERFGLDREEAQIRAALVVSQIMGMVMTRYIIKVEPMAHASPDFIVEMVGPTLQRYITAPLPIHNINKADKADKVGKTEKAAKTAE